MIKRFYPGAIRAAMQSLDPDASVLLWQNGLAKAALLNSTYTWDPAHFRYSDVSAATISTTSVINPSVALDGEFARVTCDSVSFGAVSGPYRYVVFYYAASSGDTYSRLLCLFDAEADTDPGGVQVIVDIDPAVGIVSFGPVA